MLKGIRGPILIGALLLSLFAWTACGGSDDDDDDGSGDSNDPVATLPARADDIVDDLPDTDSTDSEEGSASASITVGGETIELAGGTCTVVDNQNGGKALAVTIEPETGGLSIGIGALTTQTSADAGEPITDATISFRVGDLAYVGTGQAGSVVVNVDADLNGGDFSGAFNIPAQPGSDDAEASGTFKCS